MTKANPSGCCGVSVGCCPNRVAEKLKATFSNVQDCACADGTEIALDYKNPEPGIEYWEGTGTVCDQQETLTLECTGSGNEDWTLVGTMCVTTLGSESGSTCDPLNLIFREGGSACCDDPVSAEFEIVVTE